MIDFQYDESGGSIHDKDDLEIEMGGNEALAVAMQNISLIIMSYYSVA